MVHNDALISGKQPGLIFGCFLLRKMGREMGIEN